MSLISSCQCLSTIPNVHSQPTSVPCWRLVHVKLVDLVLNNISGNKFLVQTKHLRQWAGSFPFCHMFKLFWDEKVKIVWKWAENWLKNGLKNGIKYKNVGICSMQKLFYSNFYSLAFHLQTYFIANWYSNLYYFTWNLQCNYIFVSFLFGFRKHSINYEHDFSSITLNNFKNKKALKLSHLDHFEIEIFHIRMYWNTFIEHTTTKNVTRRKLKNKNDLTHKHLSPNNKKP